MLESPGKSVPRSSGPHLLPVVAPMLERTVSPSLRIPAQVAPAVALDSGPPRDSARDQRDARGRELLARAATADPEERQRLLESVVLLHQDVARSVARRYRARGVADEDLDQVAYLALVKAARRFDPSAGFEFLAFAVPTVRGEVRRYFRDHGWMVRPTRRIQELQARVRQAESELAFELGRSPRPSEIAEHLEEGLDEVCEALTTDGCFTPASLDRPAGQDGDAASLGDLIGSEDTAARAAEARVVLAPVVRQLGERDRRIILLRFFHGWTQEEIGRDLGVTQMQVSRLLTRILTTLRGQLEAEV